MIDVKISKMEMTKGDISFTKETIVKYIKEKVEEALKVFDIKTDTVVTVRTEGSRHDPVQKVDIKVIMNNNIINQSSHSRSIKKAINRAIPDLKQQMKKFKSKKIDKRRSQNRAHKQNYFINNELDFELN